MRLLLATADGDDVAWGVSHGLLDGVLTTPALIAAQNVTDTRAHVADLCRLVHGQVFVSVRSLDSAGAYRDGKDLAKLSDQIVVQIPLVEDTLGAMRRLRADGIRVAASHVYGTAQALLALRAGASSVITSIEKLDSAGHRGTDVVREMRGVFDASDAECDVIAASPMSPVQFGECARSGADAVALSVELCRALILHPLTDRDLDQFIGDAARLHRSWPTL